MSGLASPSQASAPADRSELAAEIRRRLGPPPDLAEWPPVSVVVLNRDGAEHLRRLLDGLLAHTDYPHLELIVVDNGSSDDSLDFLRTVEAPFPVSLIANPHNESFSDACNQGAAAASGELLLFLNNDVEPFESGWLGELVACLRDPDVGVVGASLICPEPPGESSAGYSVQTRPLRFSTTPAGDIGIHDPGRGTDVLAAVGRDTSSALAFGASMLMSVALFREVGGFTHGYWYGCEDSDLLFKVRSQGLGDLYSGRSFLIHHASSTSSKLSFERGARNLSLLRERWGPRVWRECRLELPAGGSLWSAPQPASSRHEGQGHEETVALGFCLKADGVAAERLGFLEALMSGLGGLGHRCLLLRDEEVDDPRGETYDVAVHVRGAKRYVPKSGQLNVLWAGDDPNPAESVECGQYQLTIAAGSELAARLREMGWATAVIAADDPGPAKSLRDAVAKRADELAWPTRIGR